jgi:hypothetical protein
MNQLIKDLQDLKRQYLQLEDGLMNISENRFLFPYSCLLGLVLLIASAFV